MNLAITGTTKIFATLAHPADHVRAPMLFNALFAERQIDHVMIPIDVVPEALPDLIDGLRGAKNFIGAAVTIPHKMPLAAICTRLGLAAQVTGAVNAVRFDADRRLIGDNFDGLGFIAGLTGEGHRLAGRRVLLVGAGGAGRAIAVALADHKDAPIESLHIANRSIGRAHELADVIHRATDFQGVQAVSLDADKSSYDMIINATPLGLHEDDPLPFQLDGLASECLICDIIMVPDQTRLLAEAEAAGFAVHYGRHMFDYQMMIIGKFIGALPQDM